MTAAERPGAHPADAAFGAGDGAAWQILVDDNAQPVLVYVPDSGAVVAANAAAAAFYGYPRDELLATDVAALAAPEGAAAWTAEVRRTAHGRLAHGVHAHQRRNGAPVRVDVVSHALPADDDDAPRRLAVVTDVTERAAAQLQLRHAQKMGAVGQLAGSIAHDLNNLLTVILTSAELAEGVLGRAHPATPDLEAIAHAGRRAAALTRQLLALSRKRAPHAELLDLSAVVAGPAQLLRRLVGAGITFEIAAAPGVWPVRADAGQLEQVVLNLVVNARDAMPRGGALTVATANRPLPPAAAAPLGLPPGDYAALTVADTGAGLDAATLERAFEPFFTTKAPGLGTGLGLSTVRGIARQWGGDVHAESAPGHGARFTVLLPRAGA